MVNYSGQPVLVTIDVFGEVQIRRHLLRFGERALRATPLWNSLYNDLMNIEQVQFLSEGQHGSAGWLPLAEATVRDKQRKGLQPWILRATEVLYESLTRRNALGQIREITPTFMRFGSDIPYGILHQHGTVRMARRKVIDITEPERVGIVKKVQRFIVTGEVTPLI